MTGGPDTELGGSGRLARRFQRNEITPLLALLGLLLGVFAMLVTPREEEPQIDVTMANVFIPFPGAPAREVESLVSGPAARVLAEIEGVKHTYSVSRDDLAVLTVEFEVGEERTAAIVRLYNAIFSNADWLPPGLGVGEPLIRPMGIDDVPVVALTLWSADPGRGAHALRRVAHTLETELKRVPGTRDIYTLGGPDRVVRVVLDPERLAGHGIAVGDLERALASANAAADAGAIVADGRAERVRAGRFMGTPGEVAELVVGVHDGAPVYLRDVADVSLGPDRPDRYVRFLHGPAATEPAPGAHPAVTLAVAKKPGTNAVAVAEAVIDRFEQLRGIHVPEGISATVTRNYGATAADKAQTLIHKLVFATLSVVGLVLVALGWREAIIVGVAVVVTLAATLFASWAWGFTLNRVSLFALIFSIGILVDDAIVVVENVHRRLANTPGDLDTLIPRAVDEVGGPTILATFTVIAAILPMAFVTGLMGPYMSPIPINASIGMLISLLVAFVVTPWLCHRLLGRVAHAGEMEEAGAERLLPLFRVLVGRFLEGPGARRRRWLLLLAVMVLIGGSVALVGTRDVVLKMLPFDNKSEFQVVLDMPEGTALERTAAVLDALADALREVPEVTDLQLYAGTSAPINFNGLVRQYYLRRGDHLGDIQVNLVDKAHRERKSHAIAQAVRPRLAAIAQRHGGRLKVVEVPPGPPVLAPLVAEVYGPDHAGQVRVARALRERFEAAPGVVDVDDSVEAPAREWHLRIDRAEAARAGVDPRSIVTAVTAALRGVDLGYLHEPTARYAVPVRLELPVADQASLERVLDIRVRGRAGLVPLGELVTVEPATLAPSIQHKDLLPVVYVTGDVAGETDSPLYGMFGLYAEIAERGVANQPLGQLLVDPPANPYDYAVKWDGEWQVTYDTFRDMGIAYSVGLLLIYLLVVAQFRSYLVPLIIMAPIPLTIIGVLPGHALLGAQFTATSMIGMIVLAGIIVRNSILLVDFIIEEHARGTPFADAVVRSGAVRAKPILLTGLAAMLGALFILDDPIFSGLAIALLFGVAVSTLLTLVVIPVLFYAFAPAGMRVR
ncbi:MAG: efflux RND transporter permease subunit [Gammaproteobacteria bacterium]|nr:efflux RND transporter permease subunit [Gammaproteobacteria bacterium]